MGQNLTEYFVKYELYPHPDTRCPPPSILFRPHEYSLYAPLDTFCLWSPRKPRSNIPTMLTAYTHASVYSTMQTNSWHWIRLTKMVKCVWTCFRKIWFRCWNTGAHLLQNLMACVSKFFFFFFTSKSRKHSLFLWCIACWTQQKCNEIAV